MAKLIRNGQSVGFNSTDASLINYVNSDGTKTSVQTELSKKIDAPNYPYAITHNLTTLQTETLCGNDANNLVNDGVYKGYQMKNVPSVASSHCIIIVHNFDGNCNYVFQELHRITSPGCYYRVCQGGTWGAWYGVNITAV